MNKIYRILLFNCIILLSCCFSASASTTIGSVNSYLERIDFYNRIDVERSAPTDFGDAGEEHISTFNGGVSYTKKELELPGKGGNNFTVTRSFNTAQNINADGLSKRYIILGKTSMSSSGYTTSEAVKYAFRYYINGDTSTQPLYIVYTSVYEMLEAENNTNKINLSSTYVNKLTNLRAITPANDDRINLLTWGIESPNGCGLTLDSSVLMYENASSGTLEFYRDTSVSYAEVYSESAASYRYSLRYFKNLDSYIGNGWEYQIPMLQNTEEELYSIASRTYTYNFTGVFYDPEWGNALDIFVRFTESKSYPKTIKMTKHIMFDPTYSNTDNPYYGKKSYMYSVDYEKYDENSVKIAKVIITRSDGTVFTFMDEVLESITDIRGNTISFEFLQGHIISVTDTLNRTILLERSGITVNGEKVISYTSETVNNDFADPLSLLEEDNTYIFQANYKINSSENKSVTYNISPHSRMVVLAEKNEAILGHYNETRQTLDTDKLLLDSVILNTGGGIFYDYSVVSRGERCLLSRKVDDQCVSARWRRQANDTAHINEINYSYNGSTTVTSSNSGKLTLVEIYNSNNGYLTSSQALSTDSSENTNRVYTQVLTREGHYLPSKIVTTRTTGDNSVSLIEEYTYDEYVQKPSEITRDGELIKKISYDNKSGLIKSEKTKRGTNDWIGIDNTISDGRITESEYSIYRDNGSVKESLNNSWQSFTYNTYGDMTEKIKPGLTTQYSYSYADYAGSGNTDYCMVITETVPNAQIVNSSGSISSQNVIRTYKYDNFGNLSQTIDGNGNITNIPYDLLGRPAAVSYPNGSLMQFSYDDSENTITITNPSGKIDRLIYDSLGRNTGLDSRGDSSQSFFTVYTKAYDSAGQLTEHVVYESAYPYAKALYAYFDNGNIKSEKIYQSSGNVLLAQKTYSFGEISSDSEVVNTAVSKTNASKSLTVKEYLDSYGRKIKDTYKDSGESFARQRLYTTDLCGNITSATGFVSDTVSNPSYIYTYTYDYKNRVLTENNGEGTETYRYTGDLLTSITDRAGHTTAYTYNEFGLKACEILGNALTRFYYDANGNLSLKKVKSNLPNSTVKYNTTEYKYDNMNNLIASIIHPTDSTSEITRYTYDESGNLTSSASGLTSLSQEIDPNFHSVINYAYDSFGNCLSEEDALGNTKTYSYNTLGYPVSITSESGNIKSYTYDGLMHITAISSGGESVNYTYDLAGNITNMLDNSGTTSYTYNAFGNKLTEVRGSNTLTYSYDERGNRASMTVSGTGYSRSYSYAYDSVNRLVSVTSGNAKATYTYNNDNTLKRKYVKKSSTNLLREDYTYNANGLVTSIQTQRYGSSASITDNISYYSNGNIYSKTGRSYVYDQAGRLTQETDIAADIATVYTYDARGNRLSRSNSSETVSYSYDLNNRLLSSSSIQGGTAASVNYSYDLDGNLITKQTSLKTYNYTYSPLGTLSSVICSDGAASYYTYDGNNIRQTKRVIQNESDTTKSFINDNGSVIAEFYSGSSQSYVYGLGLEAMYASNGKIGAYRKNVHGDVEGIVHEDGYYCNEYTYDAFGNIASQTADFDNPFCYCGEYLDLCSGLIYLRNRYYDPSIGRFISEDPAKAGLNWYVYANNNPVMYIDPMGEDAIIITNKNSVGIEGIATAGHTSAIYQDANGEWYYTYWGNKAAAVIHISSEYMGSLSDFNTGLNKFLSDNKFKNITKDYTDATYIVGDFTASLEAAYADVNDAATNRFSTKNGLTTLEDGSKVFQGHNSPYNAGYRNCFDKTYASLSKGTLANGTNAGTYMKDLGFKGGMIPNNAISKFGEVFMNSSFTYSGAYSSLLNYSTLYKQGSPWAQKWSKANYANAVIGW